MYKRIISFLIAILMLVMPLIMAEPVFAATDMKLSEEGIAYLKRAEGFSKYPYWDNSQWTVGYGTRCPDSKLEEYKKNGIPDADANALFREFVTSFEYYANKFVASNSLNMSQNQFDMLVCFSFNVGPAWMSQSSCTLRKVIINNGNDEEFVQQLVLWSKSAGATHPALVERRIRDANMYLYGDYTTKKPENIGYVYYNLNGGNIKNSVQTFLIKDGAINVKPLEYDAEGFLGWYTLPGNSGKKVEELTKDIIGTTLFAHWQKDENNNDTSTEETVPSEPTSYVEVIVTTDGVNLREGPGTNYKKIGTANTGYKLKITQTCENLGRLWGESNNGWICLEYTDYEKSDETDKEEVKPTEPPATTEPPMQDPAETPTEPPVQEEPSEPVPEPSQPEEESKGDSEQPTEQPEQPKQDEDNNGDDGSEEPKEDIPDITEPPEKIENPIKQGTVKVSDILRIRNGAGKSYKIVGHLKNGEKIDIFETKDSDGMTWGRIGEDKWTSLSYVQIIDENKTENDNTTVEQPKEELKEEGKKVNSLSGSVIASDALRIRKDAGTHNKIIGYYGTNDRVSITELKAVGDTTWGKTDSGWISLHYVRFNVNGTITADCLRIRHGAGTNNMIIGFYYNGASVRITEIKLVNDVPWGKTDKGWISMDYVIG